MDIELKYFEQKDVNQLLSWIDTPELLMLWAGPKLTFPLTEEKLMEYLNGANLEKGSEKFIYQVIEKESGQVTGHIALQQIDRSHKTARISRVYVDKMMRGKGVCPLIMKKVLNIGFDQFKLHRISLGVFEFNKAAIHCYEQIGFKKEGLLRDYVYINNEYWSLFEMSILEDEWKKR